MDRSMEKIITVGLDLAKSIFSSSRRRGKRGSIGSPHVATIAGTAVLSRTPSLLGGYLGGMEACASAHHWAREIAELGHSVRMMPPAHVKPFVKRNKTDVVDLEAIC
jgi:transposase